MVKKLRSLEEHNNVKFTSNCWNYSNDPILNGIACPDCGAELFDTNPYYTLASLPPQKDIGCNACEYTGRRICRRQHE